MNIAKITLLPFLAFVAVGIVPGVTGGENGDAGKAGPRVGKLEHRVVMDVEYPITGQAKVDRVIQEWLEAHLKSTMDSMSGVGLDPDHAESVNTISVGFHETNPSARAASFIFDTYTYPWRAAHPMSYVSVLNIDLDKRERLGLADIFTYPERALRLFAEKAPAAVKRDLAERFPDQFPDGVQSDIVFMEGFDAKEENYSAVSLEPNGVRILFQLYQVLPYVFGKPEAFIPLKELEEAGPKLGLWGR